MSLSPSFRLLMNPLRMPELSGDAPPREPLAFHRCLPGYAPTPLVKADALAAELGIGSLWVKDESARLGLPAFKVLGASWAAVRAVVSHVGLEVSGDASLGELRSLLAEHLPLTLVAATDGNHGRAVARIAKLLGIESRILVPADMVAARIEAIASEGASVQVVDGSYDEAVELAASLADDAHLVIADTAWPGYEAVPQWVIDGYSTILWEMDDDLVERQMIWPDLTLVQIGVGALAAAVTRHVRKAGMPDDLQLVGVEPTTAACLFASIAAGEPVTVPGPHSSSMAGLNCGVPSTLAWPVLTTGVDAFLTIDDDWAFAAMRVLAKVGVVAGETGGAGLGGLLAVLSDAGAREQLGITSQTSVLVISTEGATDPANYARIVS